MTCETFKTITSRSVLDATVSERIAARDHFLECTACRDAINDGCAEAEKILTEEEMEELDKSAKIIALQTLISAMGDSEV